MDEWSTYFDIIESIIIQKKEPILDVFMFYQRSYAVITIEEINDAKALRKFLLHEY